MVIRGIIMKMSLDTAAWRTAEEYERLSDFIEWLYAFQDALEDGYTTMEVRLVAAPSGQFPSPAQVSDASTAHAQRSPGTRPHPLYPR